MRTISVLDKVLKPGIISIDCRIGNFQHELVSPDESVVLDLASPLYHPSSSNRVYDRSGNGNYGTIVGATWKRLPSGLWHLYFDGGDDYITIYDHASFDFSTAMSAFAWVTSDDITGILLCIVSKYDTAAAGREWRFDKKLDGGELEVFFGDPNDGSFEGKQGTTNAILVNDIWTFVGFTYNAGTCIIYANGVAVASSVTQGAIPVTLWNGVSNVKVGVINDNTADWKGNIALPGVRNRVLAPSWWSAFYSQTKHFFGV